MSKLLKLSKRKKLSNPTIESNIERTSNDKQVKIKSGKKQKTSNNGKDGKDSDCIMKQYIVFYREAIKKYGSRTAVLCQVGDFFECYSYDGPECKGDYETNIEEVADAMNISIAKYNKSADYSIKNALRCGFNKSALPKFRNKLLDENFTVVIVEQSNDSKSGQPIERKITEVLSPGVSDQPVDFGYNNVVCIIIENQNRKEKLLTRMDQYELCIGMSSIDVSTNTSTVYEIASTRRENPEAAVNEVYRFLQSHNCRELFVLLDNFEVADEKEEKKLKRYFYSTLELDRYNVHHFTLNSIDRTFKKIGYQNTLLRKLFGEKLCGPGVTPIQYLDLEMYGTCVLSYCCLIDFIYQRNENYLKNLKAPAWWKQNRHLILTHNAIQQLDIISSKKTKNASLFNIINHTITNQGKRLLERKLLYPSTNHTDIETRYSQIEDLICLEKTTMKQMTSETQSALKELRTKFREICDFERYHRKLELQLCNPDELLVLIQSYKSFIDIIDWFKSKVDDYESDYPQTLTNITKLLPCDDTMKTIRNFTLEFQKVYNFNSLKRCGSYKNIQENLFNEGIDTELDEISEHLGDIDTRLHKLRIRLCNIVDRVGDKREKTIELREPKKGGKMFRGNIISSAILKWYQKQIRNKMSKNGDESLESIKIIHYENPCELYKHEASHNISDADILQWGQKKNLVPYDEITDEENDEENDGNTVTNQYLTVKDMKLLLTLNFRRNNTNMNITTSLISDEEQSSEEYIEKLLGVMKDKSYNFLNSHYDKYAELIPIFNTLSAQLDVIQSHAKTAIRYQYFKPTVIPLSQDQDCPSFIDIKGFRHPIVERIQDDIEYVKNDLKLGRETEDDDNVIGILEYAVNNSGKSTLEKAIALNIILAQSGSFVPADSLRFRPFKNIITRLDGTDNMRKGQGSFAVEMSELRTVANQSTCNTLVLGDEICRGTEQDSAISIMAATIEWLCKEKKANFIFSSHYHELLDFEEISTLKELAVYHLKATKDPETGAIIYEYKLAPGVGTTIFGIEVARSMGYHSTVCDRAIYFRNKRMNKKQHYLSTKTSQYNTNVYMDECSVEGCNNEPDDSHHEAQQQTADEFGAIGHFHKNRKHNIVPLCKYHHRLADKQLLHFEYQNTDKGLKLKLTVKDDN